MPARGLTLVILAGGASRRLGTCKALVRIGPRSSLEHLLAAGAVLGGPPPIVVAGRHFEQLQSAVPSGVRLVHNPDWERGRTGSLQAACEAAPGHDFCIAPVDVPLVPAAVFEGLARAWQQAGAPARGWLAPHWTDPGDADRGDPGPGPPHRFGHPVVLGHELLETVRASEPERELRSFRSLADPLWSIPVPGNEILDDLDHPDDLRRLRGRFKPPPLGWSPPITPPP